MNGTLILVFGPSGSGKGTLLRQLRAAHPEFVFPVSATTRPPREGETDGVDYHFLTEDAFERRIDAGAFLEWACYGGNYYGTPVAEVREPLERGEVVAHELEAQGVRQLLETMPRAHLRLIFIDGGSWEALKERIEKRGPMTPAQLAQRRSRYDDEHALSSEADYVIHNHDGDLDSAREQLMTAVAEIVSGS